VVIGVTILAYRYAGMRPEDFKQTLLELRDEMAHQFGAYNKRAASQRFEQWVVAAGGRVRGSKFEKETEESDRIKKKRLEKERKKQADLQAKAELQSLFGGGPDLLSPGGYNSHGPNDDGTFGVYLDPMAANTLDIWPLRLIDVNDDEQFAVLFGLLRRSPFVIHWWLTESVFPEVMRHQSMKVRKTHTCTCRPRD
jgi:hypothetical protein